MHNERKSLTQPAGPDGEHTLIRITFDVADAHAPALRSAVDELSGEIGGRLEGPHSFAKEAALTNAAIAVARLRAAVNAAIPSGDAEYSK